VLLTGPDAPNAAKLGERICAAVAALTDGPSGALLAPMTVSIGVAWIIPDARAVAQDLIGAADRALFDAKQGGRNRMVAAPPPVAKPRLSPERASMIPKSGFRFSEKIMLQKKAREGSAFSLAT
jgi:hypothetical protein